MPDDFKEKYRESFIYSGAGQLLERGLSVAAMIVVIRLLTREHYGIYSLLTSVASIIGVVASWGWPSIYNRYIPELRETDNRKLLASLIVKGIGSRIIATTGAIAAVLIFYPTVGTFLHIEPYRHFFELFAVGIFGTALSALLRNVLNAALKQKLVYRTSVLTTVVRDVVFILVLLLGYQLTGILIVESAAMLVVGAILLYYAWTQLVDPDYLASLPRIPSRIRKYGAFSYLNDIGNFFLDISIDTMVITKYLGVEAVALYTVAAVIPKRIRKLIPTTLLRNVLEPMVFTSYTKDSSHANLNRIFNFLTKVNFLLLLPVFGIIVFFGRELMVFVFGKDYSNAYIYLVGLSFFFFAQTFPIGYITRSVEKMHINAISKFFSLYNFVLDIILIQWIGLVGVVLATGSAQLLKTVYVYWHTGRWVDISFPAAELSKLSILVLVCAGALKLLEIALGLGLAWIGLFGAIVGICALPCVLQSWYFDQQELYWIEKFVGKMSGREEFVSRVFAMMART